MADIVIIGAGLTGLSAAYHLEKKSFSSFAIFEKENDIGGLCRSVTQDGFTFDFTGHLLHINDPYFKELIEQVVGFDTLNIIERSSFIYSHNTYTRYPFQMNLYGLPEKVVIDCITGFVNRRKGRTEPKTFPDWVQHHFGDGFARHFFIPYQTKIFAHDIAKITASWTSRFVPSTSLEQILRGSLRDYAEPAIGYNAQFFYPKQGGIISWVQRLAQAIKKPINTGFCVQSIDTRHKVITFTNGHIERYNHLITTMPLATLVQRLVEKPSTNFARAQTKLLCNTVINFNLGVRRPNLCDKHWIYFPEERYPFYRLGFGHNFSSAMAPVDCSSLYGEFAYVNKPRRWVENTLSASLKATKQLFNLQDHEIATEKIISITHAYVIYDAWRERNLPHLLDALKQESIYSVGRYGQWKYSSMQEAVLDGKKIADTLAICSARHASEQVQSPTPFYTKEPTA